MSLALKNNMQSFEIKTGSCASQLLWIEVNLRMKMNCKEVV